MNSSFFTNWQNNEKYFQMLGLMGQLSNLFSDSKIPFIHYRITENVFCKYFNAENLARTDTAYDAKIGDVGIGIKTFQIGKSGQSVEKVAEFNSLSSSLKNLSGDNLARQLVRYRNDRMETANNLFSIKTPIYHIIGRLKGKLQIFNTAYDKLLLDNISVKKDDKTSILFSDNLHEYTFNKSKSVLMKKFHIEDYNKIVPIDIIDDPYELLEQLIGNYNDLKKTVNIKDYAILPLFSFNNKIGKFIPEKSGLNQWNASGRPRNPNEVYIPIPKKIHNENPNFFPTRDIPFNLHLPDGQKLSAKLCQDGSKALMSNPNKALGEWLLRKILKIKEYELLTMFDLNRVGFDSLIITKNGDLDYSLNVCYSETFSYK